MKWKWWSTLNNFTIVNCQHLWIASTISSKIKWAGNVAELHADNFLKKRSGKETVFKRKRKKRKLFKTGRSKAKRNRNKRWQCERISCLCRKLLAGFNYLQSTPGNFAFAFFYFSNTIICSSFWMLSQWMWCFLYENTLFLL